VCFGIIKKTTVDGDILFEVKKLVRPADAGLPETSNKELVMRHARERFPHMCPAQHHCYIQATPQLVHVREGYCPFHGELVAQVCHVPGCLHTP
jgi:hypothetical protein